MDTTPEKRMKFAEVIIRKCDEVSALTNDLFLHALSDMDKLEMNMHEVKLCAFMRKAVAELISDMDSVRLYLPDSEWVISADEKRLMQLTENILNNAAKYGEMPVDITIRQKDNDTVQINFKDYGNGMKDEDIPFALIVVIMFCHRMFLQGKTDIGILKAMGLTSIQLRLSFGLRFLMLAVSGAVPGDCNIKANGDYTFNHFTAPGFGAVSDRTYLCQLLFICVFGIPRDKKAFRYCTNCGVEMRFSILILPKVCYIIL